VLCGVCGKRMGVRYYQSEASSPGITARSDRSAALPRSARRSQAPSVDEASGKLVVGGEKPGGAGGALAVHDELEQRFDQADRLRKEQVERARYEAEAARRRYLRVRSGQSLGRRRARG